MLKTKTKKRGGGTICEWVKKSLKTIPNYLQTILKVALIFLPEITTKILIKKIQNPPINPPKY